MRVTSPLRRLPMSILRVALDVPLPQLFDYECAEATAADIGLRVVVPFGRRKTVGLVIEVADESEIPAERLKPAEKILRDLAPLASDWIAVARFCSEYYQRPLGEVVFSALAPRLRRAQTLPRPWRRYALTAAGRSAYEAMPGTAKVPRRLLGSLLDGPCSETALAQATPGAAKRLEGFVEKGWIELVTGLRASLQPASGHALNAEQEAACAEVRSAFGRFGTFLLFGITGSGKTEVYLRLVAHTLAQGRPALVLVPEIALTPALEAAFRERFPGARIVVQHSGIGEMERARGWIEGQAGEADIVLGTRLAVFVPLPELGLVVVDEEQDASFKQQEGVRYSARDVAVFRAREAGVPALLVSATPSLESFQHALDGRYRLLRLTRRAHSEAQLPAIRLIDLAQAPARDGLSEPLAQALATRLARSEQSLVFLNRRGYAPVLCCNYCGWVSGCSRCAAYLVVHLHGHVLRCHHCGAEKAIPRSCPQCGNLDLTPVGRGTQRLEQALVQRFPGARIVRVDSDSTRRQVAGLLESAQSGEADILVGTQMLAKGHHFERVTLVGVVNADTGLFAADYRAPERLFAQLQQVAGRAGRAGLPGEVLIQTRFPHHPLYRALERHDFEGYARSLLEQRRRAGFPPFMYEAALRAEAPRLKAALGFLKAAADIAPAERDGITLYDPSPASLARIAGLERAQLIIQCPARPVLQRFLRGWSQTLYARPSRRVRWHFDVDPIEF